MSTATSATSSWILFPPNLDPWSSSILTTDFILQRWTHDLHPKDLASYAQCDRFQWPQSWELEVAMFQDLWRRFGHSTVWVLGCVLRPLGSQAYWHRSLVYCIHTFFFPGRPRYSFDPQHILLSLNNHEALWNISVLASSSVALIREIPKQESLLAKSIIHSCAPLSRCFHTPSLGGMLLAAIKCATVPATPQHAPPKASCRELVPQGLRWRNKDKDANEDILYHTQVI